jgi:hypothetical protein
VLGDVPLLVLQVAPALEHEGAQSLLGELLRRPPAAHPRADDDRVELFALQNDHVSVL